MANEVLLQMKNITMSFPGVKALQNVDFTLCKGEIHALMGENGRNYVLEHFDWNVIVQKYQTFFEKIEERL